MLSKLWLHVESALELKLYLESDHNLQFGLFPPAGFGRGFTCVVAY